MGSKGCTSSLCVGTATWSTLVRDGRRRETWEREEGKWVGMDKGKGMGKGGKGKGKEKVCKKIETREIQVYLAME